MIRYLIQTSEALITISILVGLIVAYGQTTLKRKPFRLLVGLILAGLVAGAVMGYLKNATNRIDTSLWNLRIFTVYLIALVAYFIGKIKPLHERLKDKTDYVDAVLLGLIALMVEFYILPDIYAYPYTFLLSGQELLSTDYLYRLIGYLLGIGLCIVAFLAVIQVGKAVGLSRLKKTMAAVLIITGARYMTSALQVLLARRLIINNHTLFVPAKISSNHVNAFIYLIMAVMCVLPICLFIESTRVNEPYRNPAEHRKIIAKWKNRKRWSAAVLVTMLAVVLNMTVILKASTKEVELSPIEEAAKVTDKEVWVSFEQVADGHLHRFAYEDNGVEIRFIVIKKPNSSSYGIGLDACDICGETGYYEKDGQVVCKLCDVVMNINTIGFKGGCNPIVIPYSIQDGYIKVPIEGLVEHEAEFK